MIRRTASARCASSSRTGITTETGGQEVLAGGDAEAPLEDGTCGGLEAAAGGIADDGIEGWGIPGAAAPCARPCRRRSAPHRWSSPHPSSDDSCRPHRSDLPESRKPGGTLRSLIVTELISLDGIVDSPGGGDHPRAGWTFKEVDFDPAAYEIKGREQDEAAALLLGRVSYEEFAPGVARDDRGVRRLQRDAQVRRVDHAHRDRTRMAAHHRPPLDRRRRPPQGRRTAARSSSTAAPRSPRGSLPPVSSTATTSWSSRSSSATASGCSPTGPAPAPAASTSSSTPTYDNGITLAVYDVRH